MQQNYGMSAVAVGFIMVAQLWMRPIAAVSAGWLGDFTNREKVLCILFVVSSIALASILIVPEGAGSGVLLIVVLAVGLATYAVRGIYWGVLESCDLSVSVKGLAIGAISLVGYSPDIYLPLIYGYLIETYPGRLGYSIYFSGIAVGGLVGAVAAWQLARMSRAAGR